MKTKGLISFTVVLFTVNFTVNLLLSASSEALPRVTYSDGFISVKARKVPIATLLLSISEATGINIYVSKDLPPKLVSACISKKPLEDALKRILRDFSYAVYTQRKMESGKYLPLLFTRS